MIFGNGWKISIQNQIHFRCFIMSTGIIPNDEATWVLIALLLFYAMTQGGVQLSLPTLGAIAFVGYIIIGTAKLHH